MLSSTRKKKKKKYQKYLKGRRISTNRRNLVQNPRIKVAKTPKKENVESRASSATTKPRTISVQRSRTNIAQLLSRKEQPRSAIFCAAIRRPPPTRITIAVARFNAIRCAHVVQNVQCERVHGTARDAPADFSNANKLTLQRRGPDCPPLVARLDETR